MYRRTSNANLCPDKCIRDKLSVYVSKLMLCNHTAWATFNYIIYIYLKPDWLMCGAFIVFLYLRQYLIYKIKIYVISPTPRATIVLSSHKILSCVNKQHVRTIDGNNDVAVAIRIFNTLNVKKELTIRNFKKITT